MKSNSNGIEIARFRELDCFELYILSHAAC